MIEKKAKEEAKAAEKKAKEKAQRKARSIAAAGFLYGGRCDYRRGAVGAGAPRPPRGALLRKRRALTSKGARPRKMSPKSWTRRRRS